ncbi:LysE family transporter [Saccharibacillus sacchari]|uniref:LysE family transporter n=1 Tax=Saccharibacillus sacchari TaxID=456493 RepID=UPI0004B17C1E|nr:LysE family transporter [Saccharibacillus sacchari]
MSFVALFSYAIAASFTPGPNNLMALDGARRWGFRRMTAFVTGVSAGCFGVTLLACLLNLALYQWIPGVRIVMGVLGTGYMLWLARKIYTSTGSGNGKEIRLAYSLRAGFWLQFVNPKLLLYAITAVSTFVMPYAPSLLQLLGVSALLGVIALFSSGSWAAFGALFQPFLIRHERAFNLIMALLLVYSAIAVWL